MSNTSPSNFTLSNPLSPPPLPHQAFGFRTALQMASQMERRRIRPTTTFRGALEVVDLKIPVWGYVKNKREALPAAKKISSLVEIVRNAPTS